MTKNSLKALVLIPKSFAVIFSLFIAVPSVDLFSIPGDAEKGLAGVLMALLPTIVSLAMIAVTWKKPKLTGIYFLLFAVAFFVYYLYSKDVEPVWYQLTCGVPAIIGILYLIFGKKAPAEATAEVKAAPKPEAISGEPEKPKAE